MLIVSIVAMIACALVIARAAHFALVTTDRRQADNAEVGYLLMNSVLYVAAYVYLWLFEPQKLIANSPASIMFVMFTIVSLAYFFRRVGALIDGRNRRRGQRREREAHP
jgi:hypothetical protein